MGELTGQRESRTRLLVFVVFVFLELRDETELCAPTALGEVSQRTLKTQRHDR